jgi:microtubule-associated protein-like 6
VPKADVPEPNDRETDWFDALNDKDLEDYLTGKPFRGAIREPSNHNPERKGQQPDSSYKLEYVYGYRSADSRQNLFFNKEGDAVYMTAALGVVLDIETNTQRYFGGGEVDCTLKNQANDMNHHTDDITCLSISNDRSMVLTGQNGSSPACFLWDSVSCQKIQRFKIPKGARQITACSISEDNSIVAVADNSDDHNVFCFDVSSGECIYKDNTSGYKIHDMQFSLAPGSKNLCCAGSKYIGFWYPMKRENEKGLYNNQGPLTSHSCCSWDAGNKCFSGGSNGLIYMWIGRSLQKTIKIHDEGFICSMKFWNGKMASGGNDGNLMVWDSESFEVDL